MPIPLQYKPLIATLLERSRLGTGQWHRSALIGQVFQVADGHGFLTHRTDPAEGPVRISVEIINRMGELVYKEMVPPDDPDFNTLNELYELANRSLEQTAQPAT